MKLLRFMFRVWDYRWLTPLCIATTIAIPIIVELLGAPSDAWRLACWAFAPVPTLALFIGATVHMGRVHAQALERGWRACNTMCPQLTSEELERKLRALRLDPWL